MRDSQRLLPAVVAGEGKLISTGNMRPYRSGRSRYAIGRTYFHRMFESRVSKYDTGSTYGTFVERFN